MRTFKSSYQDRPCLLQQGMSIPSSLALEFATAENEKWERDLAVNVEAAETEDGKEA